MHHKRKLHGIRRDNQFLGEYLAKVKATCDLLEVVGHMVPASEQVLITLSGLSEEY